MADVPYGVLLSGGLDSSLCASVIARTKRERYLASGDPSDLEKLKSFSIGLDGSPVRSNTPPFRDAGAERVDRGTSAHAPAGAAQRA